MGKSLMIQEADDERLESLKKRLGLESKIGVVQGRYRFAREGGGPPGQIEKMEAGRCACRENEP